MEEPGKNCTRSTQLPCSHCLFFLKHNCSKHTVQIDEGVPISGSEFLFEKSATPSGDKVFRRLEGALHAVLSDPSAEEAMEHIVKFVDERLEKFVSK